MSVLAEILGLLEWSPRADIHAVCDRSEMFWVHTPAGMTDMIQFEMLRKIRCIRYFPSHFGSPPRYPLLRTYPITHVGITVYADFSQPYPASAVWLWNRKPV
jgi:hypothetical protein